ncbi:MAG: cytochrome c peroxidase [Chitinophagales bacterium]|nr:cytochrome c peroxidase [Chitinophagales bacterium]
MSKPFSNIIRTGLAYCMAGMILLLGSCAKNEPLESKANPYKFVVPSNFPQPTYTFENNPITEDGFKLGRKLFYDGILSIDGSVSCNSCHQQALAFADSRQHPLSRGVGDRIGIRNAPSLTNLAFMPDFFWDGGVNHLDFVPLNAIESEVEMDETLENVLAKLNANSTYRGLFKQAFGIDSITSPYLLHALSQFTAMMVSANSKYDKYVRNEGQTLTEAEMQGLQTFKSKCSSCHSGELFSDFSFKNNGLDTASDLGRGRITEQISDYYKFRVPSLRNVARTAPYIHNAGFWTLEEVLDHYASGIVHSSTLDPSLQNGIQLTQQEKDNIISFLNTLSDYEFVDDERFFNPD